MARPEILRRHRSGTLPQDGKTSFERRSTSAAVRLVRSVLAHWAVENRLHWCIDVVFADDQMPTRIWHAAQNLAILKHTTLNLIHLDPIKRKGGIKARRFIAATSDSLGYPLSSPWRGRIRAFLILIKYE